MNKGKLYRRMHFLPAIRVSVLLTAIITSFSLHAQPGNADSLDKMRRDSVLEVKHEQGKEILAKGDSTIASDSLEEKKLRDEIQKLKATDTGRKQQLQRQLDSLKFMQTERDARIRKQVDSLRASTTGIPVLLDHDTLFFIYAKLGPFSPSDRAFTIQEKLERLLDKDIYLEKNMKIFPGEESYDILHDDMIILSITDRDGFWQGKPKEAVAEEYLEIIKTAVKHYYEENSLRRLLLRIGTILLVVTILFILLVLLNKGFNKLIAFLGKKSNKLLGRLKVRNYELLTADRAMKLITWLINGLKWVTILILTYLSLPVLFSVFPSNEDIAKTLIGHVIDPFKDILWAFIGYIPEFIAIAVIATVARAIIRFLKFLADEVETGRLPIPGFYPDWAVPTFNLARIIIYAFAFIVIFPYLPGSESPAFRGVSVFLGLLISLGSSSAISNIIAGLVITYMRAFKIGDRVMINNVVGDVLEKTMLVTRIRTIKNEDVTIPNSSILTGHTVNYTSSATTLGLILNSTVTIGYDAPWKQVHELLISAASKTEHILQEPKPFVLQTALNDFYVSYQINAYTEKPEKSATIYSELHARIQDAFNEAGVEIMSPHYGAFRDGNQITIPANYLPKDYQPSAFRLTTDSQKK